ncbi:Vi polysaccharide biosynthesis protein VipA/TviB [Chryseobacterium sp. FH2]|uniref:nucleotide sugar dehydrogenase n=1 Tax=Chryseobacterium sp. FH2 TaxID=1674291 RepID=UPI00065AADF6|nr:nucleotide sugar dehydrogenase [Chryseobacterium sp. FH2]KMQ67895.1 Vi polysaccharide biosynthesis protein VipA/TviB [Chryseobacterium sp. FH2]
MKFYKIAIIGQGYVGLPLALEFAKQYSVLGFDINSERIKQLNEGYDITREADNGKLAESLEIYKTSQGKKGYKATNDLTEISTSNIFIVTVPTPIDQYNAPDLRPLLSASKMLGEIIKKDDIIIYESTVYPGCTEEECVPILEKYSNLKFNKDFFIGYSPERINPGDKIHTLTSVMKVTSGSTPEIAIEVDNLYKKIITAGTHLAPNIKVAEASKAIENAQRDVNISFVNELALIFDKIGIDTTDVLEAAGTKYNFLKYKPGLVGGHCISVDPYYLAHKAEYLGYHPDVILSGRRVNDSIAKFIASKVVKLLIAKGGIIKNSKALILGVTFKENCPDIRNTKVFDIYKELLDYGIHVELYDPWANSNEVKEEYGINLLNNLNNNTKYDSIIIAVSHKEFLTINLEDLRNDNTVVFDTKSCLDRNMVDARL